MLMLLPRFKRFTLPVLDDDIIIKTDGGLCLGASIMAIGCGQRLVSKYFADNLIMTWLCIQQNLGGCMSELVWGKADACFVPEGALNLVAKAGSVFRFAIAA